MAIGCTALRILLVPLFAVPASHGQAWAGIVFAVCALLDFLDGHIARKYGARTEAGRYLAYIANFATFTALFAVLARMHPMLKWTVSAFALKELAVFAGRTWHRHTTGVMVGMLWHERAAAAISYFMGLFMLLYDRRGITEFTSGLLCFLCVAAQLLTLILYLYYFISRRKADPDPVTDMRVTDWQGLVMALLLTAAVFGLCFTKGDPFLSVVLWRPLYLFVQFACLVGVLGIPAYFWGEKLPRERFDPEKFPYKDFKWENGGKIYEKLGIKKWKLRTPDMSKYMTKSFAKQGNMQRDPKHLRRMVAETCSAEFVHWVLIVCGIAFPFVMDGCGILCYVLYAPGNLVSIVIQRYNRPRVMQIVKRMEMRKCAGS